MPMGEVILVALIDVGRVTSISGGIGSRDPELYKIGKAKHASITLCFLAADKMCSIASNSLCIVLFNSLLYR